MEGERVSLKVKMGFVCLSSLENMAGKLWRDDEGFFSPLVFYVLTRGSFFCRVVFRFWAMRVQEKAAVFCCRVEGIRCVDAGILLLSAPRPLVVGDLIK